MKADWDDSHRPGRLFYVLNDWIMEKETLLTGFKKVLGEPGTDGYIGDTGVTARTLDVYVDKLLKRIKSDDEATDEFYQDHASFLKAMGGQMRFEKADFVKNYKPAKEEPNPKENPADQDLLKRIELLEQAREDERKAGDQRAMRQRVSGKSAELKVLNKNLWEDAVNMVEYKEGMDEKSMTEAAKELYESKLKSYFGDGAKPYSGTESGNGGGSKSLDAFFAKKAIEGKFPTKN